MTRQLDDVFLDELAAYGPIGKTLGMVIRPPIDQLYLQERLDYNPLTGVLTWRYRSTAPGFDARACFATQAEAVAARQRGEIERGFHPMHGRR